jgi:hypothetical protein
MEKISVLVLVAALLAIASPALANWVAVGEAPDSSGVYSVLIQATYDGVVGTFPLELDVGELNYTTQGLTVEPVYPFGRISPIDLKYEILLNGSGDFTMLSNNLSIYYTSGNTLLRSDEGSLVWNVNESYWHTEVNVPFKGEYKAVVSLLLSKDSELYGGQFVSFFNSDEKSGELEISYDFDKRILIPSENFEVWLEALFEGRPLTNLELFKANLYGTIKGLEWYQPRYRYEASFTAPSGEGIYIMSIYAEGQDMVERERIYVTDISRAKSARCPLVVESISGCNDMKDVRKCVSDYKSGLIQVSENEIMQCYETATGGITVGSVICNPGKRGDFDGDEGIGESDLEVLQNLILPLSQSARQEYVDCADYNRDGVVNEDDLQCLTNVVAEKWIGDLNGGVCMDLVTDTPLKCDLDGDNFITDTDEEMLDEIVAAAEEGIRMPNYLLDTCDFNQDWQITREDSNCLDYFKGMKFGDSDTLLAAGQTIPSSCMKIYTLDNCRGIPGDINGDGVIDEIDEILIMLIYQNQISGYDMQCADVNKDGRITQEDVDCIKSYTSGDAEMYRICINCDENLPAAYHSLVEICNDGYDNNCDGFVDRTSTAGGDLCTCTANTPCMMTWDNDGGSVPGIDYGNYNVCRKLTPASGSSGSATGATSGYEWMSPDDLECDENKECYTLQCASSVFKCAYGVNGWRWYDIVSEGIPVEHEYATLERATAHGYSSVTCEDGYDNDCNCGDMACETLEEGSSSGFFGGNFWTGAGVGLVVGVACPVCAQIGSVAASVGGLVVDDTGTQSFLSGFSIGSLVGGSVGKGWHGGDTAWSKGAERGWNWDSDAFKGYWTGGLTGGAADYGKYMKPIAQWAAPAAAAYSTYSGVEDYKEDTAEWKGPSVNCTS